jgi:hypothetical protein
MPTQLLFQFIQRQIKSRMGIIGFSAALHMNAMAHMQGTIEMEKRPVFRKGDMGFDRATEIFLDHRLKASIDIGFQCITNINFPPGNIDLHPVSLSIRLIEPKKHLSLVVET